MDVKRNASTRPQERGQVLALFVLIMVTCFLVAILAVSVGQVFVRRHQAQMIVDAAALSGAASQARGLNTIARFNEKSLHFLQGIQISNAIPYMDSDSTTNERMGMFLLGGPLSIPLMSDWAGDVLKDYQNVFDFFNAVIDVINLAYSPLSPFDFAPGGQASQVIEDNFGNDSEKIFKSADLDDHGQLVDPMRIVNDYESAYHLVKLTEPEEYRIASYYYVFYHSNWALDTCSLIFPLDLPCAHLFATYGALDVYYNTIEPLVDPIKYELGKFYDNDEGTDVRFAYFLKVSSSPVLFGKNFFDDIPPIVVAAAAKPYGGYLGDTFEPWWDISINVGPYDQQDGKEISYTYKPKLVPLNEGEKGALALRSGEGFEDWDRWFAIFH